MSTRILLLPGALEREGEPPLFDSGCPALLRILDRGELFRISNSSDELPEAVWLGLDLGEAKLSPGVLSVSAFGADPPERSVHFCLDLLSTDGTSVRKPGFLPTLEELETILGLACRLETPRLRMVEGIALEHGLVWENGSIEMSCSTPAEAAEKGLVEALPEGDGEPMLRRFVDDSINLFSELELNRIRADQELPPLNLLWPWGPGFQPRLPNLALARGAVPQVESPSPRLKGLCRLVGYRHGDPWGLGSGTSFKFEPFARGLLSAPLALGVIPTIGEFRAGERFEEASWLARELDCRLLEPLLHDAELTEGRLLLIATRSNGNGLVVDFRPDGPRSSISISFSAETADDRKLPSRALAHLLEEALTA
jgi:hypothetical protein